MAVKVLFIFNNEHNNIVQVKIKYSFLANNFVAISRRNQLSFRMVEICLKIAIDFLYLSLL